MKKIEEYLKDGITIGISGIDSSYYPKKLINAIKDSGVKNLTLFYIEDNSDIDPAGDPMELIYNGQVSKLITSHLGELSKTFSQHLKEIELIPMDILSFKMQAGANRLPGIAVDYDYAKLYRDEAYIAKNEFAVGSKLFVFEEALNSDIGIVDVDYLDPETSHCACDGTAYTSMDIARSCKVCFVEYHQEKAIGYNGVDIPGFYVTGSIKSDVEKYIKTNW